MLVPPARRARTTTIARSSVYTNAFATPNPPFPQTILPTPHETLPRRKQRRREEISRLSAAFKCSLANADHSGMKTRSLSLLVGATFFLVGGTTVAAIAIVVFATASLSFGAGAESGRGRPARGRRLLAEPARARSRERYERYGRSVNSR